MAEARRYANFTLTRRIGEGGMGVVWEAFDERRRRVALKTLREVDAHSLYLFKNEFRELADLRHPNLVELGELVCHEGQWFFTMELVDGVDLLAWVRHNEPTADPRASLVRTCAGELDGRLSPEAMLAPTHAGLDVPVRWPEASNTMPAVGRRAAAAFDEARVRASFVQLGAALVALHAAGKIHRDIKPSNVLVDRSGRVVLLDFGLVTHVRGDVDDRIVGTPAYMAPEQAGSRPVTPAADLYGVGAVLYEALAGRLPFEGRPLEMLVTKQRDKPLPPREWVDGVPADLEALCLELLAVDPEARPTAPELVARLGGAARVSITSMRAPTAAPFVGRDAERGRLRELLATSRDGGAAVMIDGESGVGKSSLVRRFVDEAAAINPATVVLWGRCYERESVPYQAFDRIVDALSQRLGRTAEVPVPPHAAALVRLFPVLRRVPAFAAAPVPAPAAPRAQRAAGFAALRGLLGAIAQRRPLIVVIDDLQWADRDSWDLLAEVLRAPAPRMLLVAIGRGVRAPDGVSVMDQLARLSVGVLPTDDARRLAELLGVDGGDRLVAETGGHPMFLHEMARSPGARADTLDEVIGRRVDALDGEARALLEILAVAGGPVSFDVAVGAAGLDADAAARAASTLRAGRFARDGAGRSEQVETYHDRVRAAVLGGLDEAARRGAHAALGRALEASGIADPQVLVAHLERAGESIAAAFHAERGARAAVEALAFEQAAGLWDTALRLGQHTPERRRELVRARADALANAGRGAEAAAAYLAATEGVGPTERLDCQRRAAEHLLGSGHIERGFAVLREVLAEFGEGLPATPRRALLRLAWSRARIRIGGLRWRLRDVGDIPPRELVRLDAFKAVAVCIGPIDLMRGAEFQARLLRAALRAGERRQLARALVLEAIYVTTRGRRTEAHGRDILAQAGALAEAADDRYLQGWRLGGEGMASHSCGHFALAAQQLGEADDLLRDVVEVTPWEIDIVRLFRILSLRLTGRLGAVRAPFEEYLRDARHRGDRFSETTLVMAINMSWLAIDEPAQAVAALDAANWQPLPGSYHTQHFYALLARIEHALYVGDAGARPRLAAEMTALDHSFAVGMETVRMQRAYMYGRLALAEAFATPSSASRLAEVARWIGQLEQRRLGYADAWARALAAGVAAARGDVDAARSRLTELITIADGDGDQPLLAACARVRLAGEVGGAVGDELAATAAAAFEELGVANPARMADVWLPWPRARG